MNEEATKSGLIDYGWDVWLKNENGNYVVKRSISLGENFGIMGMRIMNGR